MSLSPSYLQANDWPKQTAYTIARSDKQITTKGARGPKTAQAVSAEIPSSRTTAPTSRRPPRTKRRANKLCAATDASRSSNAAPEKCKG